MIEALLIFQLAVRGDAAFDAASVRAVTIAQGTKLCGWVGVRVSPMTLAFAQSVGMVQPYGAILDQPEPGSPAFGTFVDIEQGDVLIAINGAPLAQASDFEKIISQLAPGDTVYFDTLRNGQAMRPKMTVGSVPCPKSG